MCTFVLYDASREVNTACLVLSSCEVSDNIMVYIRINFETLNLNSI